MFVPRGSELWSFVPLPILTRLLGPIVDLEASVSVAREEVEASPDAQRPMSWLLRKHWERYLLGFQVDGLVLEGTRTYRAYYEGKGKASRDIVWDTPPRRGNRPQVAQPSRDRHRPWVEHRDLGQARNR